MIIYPDGPSINFVNSILEKDIIKRIPSDYSLNLLISSEAKLEENNKTKSSNKSINVNNIQRDLINLLNYENEQSFILDKNDKEINNLNQGYFDNKQNYETISNSEEMAQLIDENINEGKGINNKTKNSQNTIENQNSGGASSTAPSETKKIAIAPATYGLKLYNIREIDCKKIKEDFTLNEVNAFTELYTTMEGSYMGQTGGMISNDSAKLIEEENQSTISIKKDEIDASTQDYENNEISIYVPNTTISRGYVNGIFLVKLPSQIIDLSVNDVTSSNDNVKIAQYSTYKEDNNCFIKIVTSNEEPTKGIRITIKTAMLLNPMAGAGTSLFELYAYNENHNVYFFS